MLDKVAEKAVANLEKFLNDLTPAGEEFTRCFLMWKLTMAKRRESWNQG